MTSRWSFIIFIIVFFSFNITEFECSKKTSGVKNRTRTLSYAQYAPAMMTEFPLGISDVFDDASDVFRKIIGKMIAKKKLIGMDSGWYW